MDTQQRVRQLVPRLPRWLSVVGATSLVVAGLAIGRAVAVPATAATSPRPASSAPPSPEGSFNQPGNVLIADQFNNRVVELDAENDVVFQFGIGPNDISPRSIVGVNDAERVGSLTLMAGTGVPAANPPLEPKCLNGCADNRVILVNQQGTILWQYGRFGVTGSGPDELNTPVQCTYLPDGHILITDQANERVIEVNMAKQIVWQYGTTGVSGTGPDELNNPNSAELLPGGNVLISDENNNRAIVVTHGKKIVQTYSGVYAGMSLSGVAFASRLPNGNTLITDSNNNRVLEISPQNKVVWSYTTNTDPGSNSAPLPTRAIRLRDGDTLISDQFNNRVVEVDHGTPAQVIRQWGTLNMAGIGRNAFNGPYDAKVIGDYTGLTPPTSSQGRGFRLAGRDGGVFAFGRSFLGSLPQRGVHVTDIVAMASADAGGYWLVGADGSVYPFGDAKALGSLPGLGIHVSDVVGIGSPDPHGYWLYGADGAVYSFGDATFLGSLARTHLGAPIAGNSSSP